MNIVKEIQRFNAGRDSERLAMKYRNMRSDPFVFMRASCHLFYARLPSASVLHDAPAAWACGDLHLENFGSYKGDNGQVYFDINDFDEALLAPASWDLVRCLASILVGRDSMHLASRNADLPAALCQTFLGSYCSALVEGKARWVERDIAPSPVSDLLQAVRLRHRQAFLDARTVQQGRRRLIRIDGRKALAVTAAQKSQVHDFVAQFAASLEDPRSFQVLDVARRVAGNGSLGLERFVVLVRGKGSPDGNYLLDLKQAIPASASRRAPLPQPAWQDEAQRVVSVQQRMQAVSMAFLCPVLLDKKPYILRALQPSEDKVALVQTRHPVTKLDNLVRVMGQCLAWSQLRSSGRGGSAIADELIKFGAKKKWQSALMELAHHCADQVEQDWRTFSDAYDAGVFRLA